MKILMTGFTPRAVGSTKLLYEYMSNTSVITKILRQLGHEIDQRIVDVEEQGLPQKYDVALIGIAVPQSLSSRYLFGALWTAEQFGPERVRFYVDDWLMHQFESQLMSGLRNPEKRFYSLDNRHCYDAAQKYTAVWVKWYNKLLKERTPLLIPAFPWAKPRVLLPKLPKIDPVIFDPTPLAFADPQVFWGSSESHLELKPEDPEDRQRAWTLAAMRDVMPWFNKQKFEWPVAQYGNKRQGQQILTEKELVQNVYTQNWGVIGAPYPVVTAGGGWRARYIHAAMTDSILFLDPDEGKTAGPPYNLFRTVVENATTQQLTEIAARQKYHLIANTWSLDQLKEALDTYIKEGRQA